MNSFGEQLQKMRTERKLSQDDLATAIGVHQTTISGIERNERLPSMDLLIKLSEFLGVALDELIDKDAWDNSRLIARNARSVETVQ